MINADVTEIVVASGQRRSEIVEFRHKPAGTASGKQRAAAAKVQRGAGQGRRKLRILVEPGGALDMQELHRGSGACAGSLRVDMELAPGARARYAAVLEDDGEGRFGIERRFRLGGEAQLDFARVGLGAASDRETVQVGMNGAGARFRHGALMLIEPERRAELDVEIAHHAPGAASESSCRCILGAGGSGWFAGKILIAEDGQGANARLRNDNLLLDQSARIETRPELEVYADEVQCAHGAATGTLDEAALFYLRTRGLPANQAHAMLVRAFASRISNAIELAEAREMAARLLNRAFNGIAPRKLAA